MAERAKTMMGQIGTAAFLLVVWVMLWGGPSWVVVIGGAALAVTLTRVFAQPPVPFGPDPRPGRLLAALVHTAGDVARATLVVAPAAIRSGPATRAELVRVTAPACAPEVLVFTASLISLSPGTLVVEIDPKRNELLIHVLPVDDLDQSREEVQRMTDRYVRALEGGTT